MRMNTKMHSSEIGDPGESVATTQCVIMPGKRNMLTKPSRVQSTSSFLVILTLFIAECVQALRDGLPLVNLSW